MTERLLVLAILAITVGVPGVITWKKGQRGAFWIGLFFFGAVWLVAACRLAQPSSEWARRFYGPRKMERARRRFGEPVPDPPL